MEWKAVRYHNNMFVCVGGTHRYVSMLQNHECVTPSVCSSISALVFLLLVEHAGADFFGAAFVLWCFYMVKGVWVSYSFTRR